MKGVTNIIEAVIGAIIILGVMMFLFTSQPIHDQDMYDTAYSCLEYAKDFSDMNSALRSCLPSSYDFQAKICNAPIGCADSLVSTLPANATITSAEYIDSGPRLIKLWVYK